MCVQCALRVFMQMCILLTNAGARATQRPNVHIQSAVVACAKTRYGRTAGHKYAASAAAAIVIWHRGGR